MQHSRTKCLTVEEGSKLFERSEFLAPPQASAERGKPKAKVAGGFSFASFSLAGKENEDINFYNHLHIYPQVLVTTKF